MLLAARNESDRQAHSTWNTMSPSCGYFKYFIIASPLCLPCRLKLFLITSLLHAAISQTLESGLQFVERPDHVSTFCTGFLSSLGSVVKCCCFFFKQTSTDLPLSATWEVSQCYILTLQSSNWDHRVSSSWLFQEPDRASSAAGLQLWSDLHHQIRAPSSPPAFEWLLETLIFLDCAKYFHFFTNILVLIAVALLLWVKGCICFWPSLFIWFHIKFGLHNLCFVLFLWSLVVNFVWKCSMCYAK